MVFPSRKLLSCLLMTILPASMTRTIHIMRSDTCFLVFHRAGVFSSFLNPGLARQLEGHLQAQLGRELDAIQYPEPVRAFFIFLNLNGPRRHLVNHFENIDQHRLEFQWPFYDSELLEYLTSIAVDPCLYHRFYVNWLSLFEPAVREVPWQAYPGHVPSTVPIPDDLPDQWTGHPTSGNQPARVSELLRTKRGDAFGRRFS